MRGVLVDALPPRALGLVGFEMAVTFEDFAIVVRHSRRLAWCTSACGYHRFEQKNSGRQSSSGMLRSLVVVC